MWQKNLFKSHKILLTKIIEGVIMEESKEGRLGSSEKGFQPRLGLYLKGV
jgi:hypothetical protein